MKFFKLTFVALLAFTFSTNAQVKVVDKAIINVPGLHCDLDKDRIERSIFRMDGLGKYKIDVKKKTIMVTWLTDRTNLETIKAEIANAGYDADNVTAEEGALKRIPAGCRVVTVAKPVVAANPVVAPALPKMVEAKKSVAVPPASKPTVVPAKKTATVPAPIKSK